MIGYSYKAEDVKSGEIIKGESEATDEESLRKALLEQGYIVVKVKTIQSHLKAKKMSNQKMYLICSQLKLLIESGIDVKSALEMMKESIRDEEIKGSLERIIIRIEEGHQLSVAVEREGIYSELFVCAVSSSEQIGKLEEILDHLSAYYKRRIEIKQQLVKAATYPLIVMGVLVVVMAVVMLEVVPSYVNVFEQQGIDLPTFTVAILSLSEWLARYYTILLSGLLMMGVAVWKWGKKKENKVKLEEKLFKLPIIGSIKRYALVAMFADMTYILAESGVPLINAMESSARMTEYCTLQKVVSKVKEKVNSGERFEESLVATQLWPPTVLAMLKIGGKSGEVLKMFNQVSRYCEGEVKNLVQQAVVWVEPALTITVAVIIGGVVMAVMMPAFTLTNRLL